MVSLRRHQGRNRPALAAGSGEGPGGGGTDAGVGEPRVVAREVPGRRLSAPRDDRLPGLPGRGRRGPRGHRRGRGDARAGGDVPWGSHLRRLPFQFGRAHRGQRERLGDLSPLPARGAGPLRPPGAGEPVGGTAAALDDRRGPASSRGGPRRVTPWGRAITVRLVEEGGKSEDLSANQFRLVLGAGLIRSTMFTMTREGADMSFTGRGSGHGVGLDQWGARAMALQGYTFEQILSYYYTGISVERRY